MSKTNLSIGVIITTAVVVMALFFWPEKEKMVLTAARINGGMLEQTCMLQGEAVSGDQQLLVSPVQGQVEHVYVHSGDAVVAGQLLVRLSTAGEETALAQLHAQQFQNQSIMENQPYLQGLEWFNQQLNFNSQYEMIMTSIEGKQIRASKDGVIQNLYVSPGDYINTGGMLGVVTGNQQRVNAYWHNQDGQMPTPGMLAWWCSANGERKEALQLESVGAPQQQNGVVVYPLVFRCLSGEDTEIRTGETAPVCLLQKQIPTGALAPLEAVDQQDRLWVLSNGSLKAIKVEWNVYDDQFIRVSDELAGAQVIVNPQEKNLVDGMRVKLQEDV